MSGSNPYSYYYRDLQDATAQHWRERAAEYSQNYLRRNDSSSTSYDAPPPPTPSHSRVLSLRTDYPPPPLPPSYQPIRYVNYPSELENSRLPDHYSNRLNWQRNQRYKRSRQDLPEPFEPKTKSSKKKKKPLSLNNPNRRTWTSEEAEMALAVERECNKRIKNQSLLIKFPDLELNKDIVAKFHPAIENVHFQQPSAPRFCFVTLQDSADPDAVIKELNKQKFGQGYITAEYKRDREDDQNLGPNDIDPTTLYVGNLAQEITKEDMVKTFPKVRRIDIGYAKKMKYTRYAFVTFSKVADAIEAFKKTHSTQLHSKSLIVRFRRLHGPVGMPGETKLQNPPKKPEEPAISENGQVASENNDDVSITGPRSASPISVNSDLYENSSRSPQHFDTVSIKTEPPDSEEDIVNRIRHAFDEKYQKNVLDKAFAEHRPLVKEEIKQEIDVPVTVKEEPKDIEEPVAIKSEPKDIVPKAAVMVKREGLDHGSESEETDSEEERSVPLHTLSNIYTFIRNGNCGHLSG